MKKENEPEITHIPHELNPTLELIEGTDQLKHSKLFSDELWQFINLRLSFIQRYKTSELANCEVERLYYEEFERLVQILAFIRRAYFQEYYSKKLNLEEIKEVVRHQYDCFLDCPVSGIG